VTYIVPNLMNGTVETGKSYKKERHVYLVWKKRKKQITKKMEKKLRKREEDKNKRERGVICVENLFTTNILLLVMLLSW